MLNNLLIGTRLYILMCFLFILLITIGFLGLYSAKKANNGLDTVYKDRVVPLKDLKVIADMYAVNIVDTSHKVRNGNLKWDEGRKNVDEATRIIAKKWGEYLATNLVDEENRLVKETMQLMKNADSSVANLTNILNREDTDALARFTIAELYPVIDPVSGKFSELVDVQLKVAKDEYTKSTNTYKKIKTISIMSIIIGVLLASSLSWMIIRSISIPMNKAAAMVETMAKGDFSTVLDIIQKDEIGLMAKSLNIMSNQLGSMVKEVINGVNRLTSSSSDMAEIAQKLSVSAIDTADKSSAVTKATEEMSINIQSVSAAMEQSSSNVNMVASSAEEMTATVNEIAQNAEKARSISEAAVRQSQHTSEKMTILGESARKIGRVTETITEISEQTNLLALNATIEAARAGEAGKGFAVVANEIKELARQTADATVDIKERINEMQETTSATVADIEEITGVIAEINNMINGIATAVEEQSAASSEISNNISQASQGIAEVNENVAQSTVAIAEITRDIAGINQQSTQVGEGSNKVQLNAQSLADLAGQLENLVKKFKV